LVYAMLYAENADIVGIYESRDAALADLLGAVTEEPELRDELGLCVLENGRPVSEFQSAGELLRDRLPQQRFGVAPSSGQ
jgi:hypothetical protein